MALGSTGHSAECSNRDDRLCYRHRPESENILPCKVFRETVVRFRLNAMRLDGISKISQGVCVWGGGGGGRRGVLGKDTERNKFHYNQNMNLKYYSLTQKVFGPSTTDKSKQHQIRR